MQINGYILEWENIIAVAFFAFCWIGYARFTELKSQTENNLLSITNNYRLQWMHEMIRRDNRTMDAIMVGNLQRSIAFFANTSIFIVLGLVTMLGYEDQSNKIIRHIPFAEENNTLMWEVKIFLLIVIFIYSFFKYTWSMRQYNYAGIFISSVPAHDQCGADADRLAAKGSYLIANAGKHFNNGLRAYYFGLAALSWFINPLLFMCITAFVVFVTHRREYSSKTLSILGEQYDS